MSHCIICLDDVFPNGLSADVNHGDVTSNKPIINKKYKNIQMLINLCLLLLSTFTPAGNASNTAGITSLKPRIPMESLLPVISYNFHPNKTGVMRSPAINRKRAMTNQVNSLLINGWRSVIIFNY